MSLLGWLGASGSPVSRPLSPIRPARPERTVLGVLGTRSNVPIDTIREQLMDPIVAIWGEPDAILLPAEGDSSYGLESLAGFMGIPVQRFACDWTKHGKRASMLRDAAIQREATHLLLLQGPRSNAMTQLAHRLARRGRPVVISERPGQPVCSPEVLGMKSPLPVENGQAPS